MIKVAICDDEKVIASQIKKIIKDIGSNENIPTNINVFSCGESLEKAVQEGVGYDLIYLDIQMKGENGITAARNIREKDKDALIVFVSGHDQYVMELFRLDVFDFVKKPIDMEMFTDTFLAANQKICDDNRYFAFTYKGKEHKFPHKEIVFFESQGRKIHINLRNRKIESFNGKLSDVEAELAGAKTPFLRIHQSYLVNYHQIRTRSTAVVILLSGKDLPISEDRQKEFSRKYGKLLGGEIGD